MPQATEFLSDPYTPFFVPSQVDDEMAVLLSNLKDMVEAERAAKLGKKGKKKKKAKVHTVLGQGVQGSARQGPVLEGEHFHSTPSPSYTNSPVLFFQAVEWA